MPSPPRHPLVVGTVAAVVALAAAVSAAAAWAALVDGGSTTSRPEAEVELRFGPEDDEGPGGLVPADAAGSAAPTDSFPLLGGGLGSIADHAGRPVVVNFFGSWCAPCIREMPAIEALHLELGDTVDFLGLAVRDSERDAAAIVERTGVTYRIGRDPSGKLFSALGIVNMPSTFLVSPAGDVVAARSGELSADELRALIERHLAPS